MSEYKFQDHPDVELIHHVGGDQSVLSSMMVSTLGANAGEVMIDTDPEGAEGRIRFLMKNRHGTPFEHNQFCFFVSAGIFVFREFHRHRIGWSYNEESGRYTQLNPRFYVPNVERPLKQIGKPGAYEMVPAPELHPIVVAELCASYRNAYSTYESLLELGVAREIARLVLPVGIFSSMYATCNARSLMAFLSLRSEHERAQFPSKPQLEIQHVAAALEAAFAEHMPITHKAFCDFGRVCP